jgi:catechol 2,3-dioxygenase-like lactoylglutathione lyase family enzyme
MTDGTRELAAGVQKMRPFVPAKDFDVSKRFYRELGFEMHLLGDKLAEMRLGPFAFLLQDYYVEQWADNFMMHVLVDDLEAWWGRIASLDLAGRYGVQAPRPPKLESWGLTVAYVFDPAGVLWHFAEQPEA